MPQMSTRKRTYHTSCELFPPPLSFGTVGSLACTSSSFSLWAGLDRAEIIVRFFPRLVDIIDPAVLSFHWAVLAPPAAVARPDQGCGLGDIGGGFWPRESLTTLPRAWAPLWCSPIVLALDSAVAALASFASKLASLVRGAPSAAGGRGRDFDGDS